MPGRLKHPSIAACSLVDELLDELQAASTGLAARPAIGATRQIPENRTSRVKIVFPDASP